jgi:beta-ureidopropionase / N-carbamoyl-L-amino-acid hydrolase
MPFGIDPDQLVANWQALSTFRDDTQPGWTRRPFTEPYRQARAWLREQMLSAGLEPAVDAGGNLVGARAGSEPGLGSIVLGSHTDTVTGGGRFDGMLGVLAAIEVARSLRDHGIELRHSLEVVDFLAEEPTDFGISTVGSRAWAGELTADMLALRGGHGTLGEAITTIGGDPERLGSARRRHGDVAVYLELHIEQGPVLESAGQRLGVVTAITGIARFLTRLEGRPDHAGTMPMALRRDALAGAAEIVSFLEEHWQDGAGVGTVGRLRVEPNATNVVPGVVELSAEMRSVDAGRLEAGRLAFPSAVHAIAGRRQLEAVLEERSFEPPVLVPDAVQALLAQVVDGMGQSARRLPSFAGHDANQVAKIAPIGMLFVPSHNGRSHCPEEWTDLADAALGARALGEAVLRFDDAL